MTRPIVYCTGRDWDRLLAFSDLAEQIDRLRAQLGAYDPSGLPGIPLDTPESVHRLPTGPAIYFLRSASLGLLYIGRATNLRGRWTIERKPYDTKVIDWDRSHAKLRESVELGDVTLHWWVVPREYLAISESLLLQVHEPPWNNHRG